MMKTKSLIPLFVLVCSLLTCNVGFAMDDARESDRTPTQEKLVIYQVFTRLFGNQQEHFIPWGSIEENGVGKFDDFSDAALQGIKELGTTHIWYTGVLHHAVIRDYTQFGICNDDPDVVKGRAGSPYAVKDYYQVDPDLAVDPANRLAEFDALIERTHRHGMKVIIDIVPNHIARRYEGLNNPEGVEDFGAGDDTSVEYARDNHFYYLPGRAFETPELPEAIQVLGGANHLLADGKFEEYPAKWTGNGARKAKPDATDWYETVKINYGVRPDGTHDFPSLPEGFEHEDYSAHFRFWKGKELPSSWYQFRDIALFWLDRGVDGFRFDMAEMVPVEFWSFLNSSIKTAKPNAFLLAEVYQPSLFRSYIQLGKMDYLYDKVDLYDSLKAILRGEAAPMRISEVQEEMADIEHHMLHFLENHDEQRIASPDFAGDPIRALPLMVLSATISSSPTMIYFGQEVGEDGSEDAGFGDPTRTSLFDYIGVPAHQRWMNHGVFDGGALTDSEAKLRNYYVDLLNLTRSEPAFRGKYLEIHRFNESQNPDYPANKVFAFVRVQDTQTVVVVVNFSDAHEQEFDLHIPKELLLRENNEETRPHLRTLLGPGQCKWKEGKGESDLISIRLKPSESLILEF